MGANFPTAGVSLLSLAFLVPEEDVTADPQSSRSARYFSVTWREPCGPSSFEHSSSQLSWLSHFYWLPFLFCSSFLGVFLGCKCHLCSSCGRLSKAHAHRGAKFGGEQTSAPRSLCNLVCGGLDENVPQRCRDLHIWSPVTGAVGKAVEPLSVYSLTSLPASFCLVFASFSASFRVCILLWPLPATSAVSSNPSGAVSSNTLFLLEVTFELDILSQQQQQNDELPVAVINTVTECNLERKGFVFTSSFQGRN